MKSFDNETFLQWYDDGGHVFSDVEFMKCRFESCGISVGREVRERSVLRNMRLTNCEQRGCYVGIAAVEDVVVDGLKTNGLLQTWGAVFKHVSLVGKIDRVMFSPAISGGLATVAQQRDLDRGNADYYARIDWALDIVRGDFQECEIQRIPARLIRRDTQTQVVVTRQRAMTGAWRRVDLSNTHWATSLDFFLERGDEDVVLVAGRRHKKFKQLLEGLQKLRDIGVAEAD